VIALFPGWVDAYAKACSTKDDEAAREILGAPRPKPFRIDQSRLALSRSRGGRKGGKVKKGPRRER